MSAHSADPWTPSERKLIDEFVETAGQYCSLIEGHQQYPLGEFLKRVRDLLPVLYSQALRLPDVTSSDDKNYRDITHEQWAEKFERLAEYLGPHDGYWIVFDPVKKDAPEPIRSGLSGDLADIWRDLKNGLIHWNGGLCSTEIIRQWNVQFHIHWSDHAAAAIRTINWLIEDYDVGETD